MGILDNDLLLLLCHVMHRNVHTVDLVNYDPVFQK